jgi:hypothetical protein
MENHSNINSQFVTFEIASELKELGFDEKCLAYFAPLKTELTIWYNPEITNEGEFILAPLWSQVIDWFRTNHNIDIGVYPCFVFNNHYNYEIINKRDFDNILVSNNDELLSYETAREHAILKAIKLL